MPATEEIDNKPVELFGLRDSVMNEPAPPEAVSDHTQGTTLSSANARTPIQLLSAADFSRTCEVRSTPTRAIHPAFSGAPRLLAELAGGGVTPEKREISEVYSAVHDRRALLTILQTLSAERPPRDVRTALVRELPIALRRGFGRLELLNPWELATLEPASVRAVIATGVHAASVAQSKQPSAPSTFVPNTFDICRYLAGLDALKGSLLPEHYAVLVPARDRAKLAWQTSLFESAAVVDRLFRYVEDEKWTCKLLQPGFGRTQTAQRALFLPILKAALDDMKKSREMRVTADSFPAHSALATVLIDTSIALHGSAVQRLATMPFSRPFLLEFERNCSELLSSAMKASKAEYESILTPMILMNNGLVYSYMKKCKLLRDENALDLAQMGQIGLLRAAELFSAESAAKFSTYAFKWIQQGISRERERIRRLIQLPPEVNRTMGRIEQFVAELPESKRNERLDPAVLAKEFGRSIGEVIHALEQRQKQTISLDQCVGNSGGRELINFLAARDPNTDKSSSQFEGREQIRAAFSILGPRVVKILSLRFGLQLNCTVKGIVVDDFEAPADGLTLDQVARLFNLSHERVRQIQAKGLKTLRSSTNPLVRGLTRVHARDEAR